MVNLDGLDGTFASVVTQALNVTADPEDPTMKMFLVIENPNGQLS